MDIIVVTAEPALNPGAQSSSSVHSVRSFSHALPKALKQLGHRCRVISPLYQSIDPSAHGLARRLSKLSVDVDGEQLECELYDGRTPGGVEVVFIGHPELFAQTTSLENGSVAEVARRAGAFARAVVAYVEQQEQRPDVLHGHNWLGALTVALANGRTSIPRLLLTINQPKIDVTFGPEHRSALGLASGTGDSASPLLHGIRSAGMVTTVSPTYAKRLAEGNDELAQELSKLGDKFIGVLSGVDASVWNPATDAHLPSRFDPMDLRGKATCKAELQRQLGLPVRDDVPLIGVLASADVQGGFDLIPAAIPRLMRNDCQCVVVWEGKEDHALVTAFDGFSQRWPDRMQVRVLNTDRQSAADEDLEHTVIGASDLVIVPSRQQPCGYVQMYAHRYGALPIVRRTGGLADTVVDCDANLGTGNGFVFDQPQAEELLAAVQRGLSAFQSMGAFTAVQRRAMRIDHSWDRSARIYEQLYRG